MLRLRFALSPYVDGRSRPMNVGVSLLLTCAAFAPLAPAHAAVVQEPAAAEAPAANAAEAEAAASGAETPETGAAIPEVLPGHSSHGVAFDEGPRQAAVLIPGTGVVSFPVTSSVPEVQAFVEQGIGQLHGFWYLEAERSFRQAAFLDPQCAIAYWGMAMANVNNAERAKGFIAKAKEREEGASDRERRYVRALHAYLNAETNDTAQKRRRAEDYLRALEDIALDYPDDLEAVAFQIFGMWDARRDELGIVSHLAVEALLAELFRRAPMHPAHHYRIHLWDYRKAEKALESARLCGPSAPAIAHMWHMPGHIYSRLERYEEAVILQEASARVDHAHQRRFGLLPDEIHNYSHNNEWLARNLSFVGRVDDAVRLACNLIELPRHPKLNRVDSGGSSSLGRQRLFDLLAEHRLWDLTIALVDSPYLEPQDDEDRELDRLALIGSAAAMTGDAARTEAILADLRERLARIEQEEGTAVAAALETFDRDHPLPVEAAPVETTPSETFPAESVPSESTPAASGATGAEPGAPIARGPSLGSDDPVPAEGEPSPPAEVQPEEPQPPSDAEKAAAERTEARGKAETEARKPFESRRKKVERKLALVEGHRCWQAGDFAGAYERLKEGGEVDGATKAELRAAMGEVDAALEELDKQIGRRKGQIIPQAIKAWVLDQAGRRDEAIAALESLRRTSGSFDLDAPLVARLNDLAVAAGLSGDWRIPTAFEQDPGGPADMEGLGPFRWTPIEAPSWRLEDADGNPDSLDDRRGRPLVVIFYLGAGCLHCVEQLEKFGPQLEAYRQAGLDIVAISSEDREQLKRGIEDYGKPMPIRLLAGGDLEAFRAFRCFDDFESTPLHGTFLIDGASRIRWKDIGPEPFMDPEFLLREAQRQFSLDAATTRLTESPATAPLTENAR